MLLSVICEMNVDCLCGGLKAQVITCFVYSYLSLFREAGMSLPMSQ